MAKTLFIVADNVATGMPQPVLDGAIAETKRLFAFAHLAVELRAATRIPALLDFSDSVIRFVENSDGVASYANDKFGLQSKNVRKAISQRGFNLTESSFGRFSGAPERVGVAFMHKVVVPGGSAKLRVTMMGGAVSLQSVQEGVVSQLAGGRSKGEILKSEADARKKEAKDPKYKYKGSTLETENKRDLAFHALMDSELKKWPAGHQDSVGKALGRVVAHEARHQYLSPHADTELGSDEPNYWGDKNFEQFSQDDQSAITLEMRSLAQLQATATIHIGTFPSGEPFPY
jgi:hypothetical protein